MHTAKHDRLHREQRRQRNVNQSAKRSVRPLGEISYVQEAYNQAVALVEKHKGLQSGSLTLPLGHHIFYDLSNDTPAASSDPGAYGNTAESKQLLQIEYGKEKELVARRALSDTDEVPFDLDLLQRIPPPVDNGRLEQMQMLSDFLELHFPTAEAKASMQNRRSYLNGLPDIDLSSSPMLRNAVEAICYAHAGTKHKDDRLVRQSQMSYGKVLNGLVRTMKDSPQRNDPRVVVPSIMLLCLYDDSSPSTNQLSPGWRAHYWGIHEYLRVSGPSSFNVAASFERLVFMNLRAPLVFLGISRRKAIVLSEPEWQALSEQVGPTITSGTALQRRAMRLPGLMERADMLVYKKSVDAADLIADLLRLRSDLLYWSVHESSFCDSTARNHDIVNVDDYQALDMEIEEHVAMKPDHTFTRFFSFVSHRVAEDMTGFWMFCLMLDCTLLRILHFVPDTKVYIKPKTFDEILKDAQSRARNLCRSAYHISKFNSQGIAGYLDTIIALAENFFDAIEATEELVWCRAVRNATKKRIERLRTYQARTLCRIGELADELAVPARFRTRDLIDKS